jgi:hypothetical protein
MNMGWGSSIGNYMGMNTAMQQQPNFGYGQQQNNMNGGNPWGGMQASWGGPGHFGAQMANMNNSMASGGDSFMGQFGGMGAASTGQYGIGNAGMSNTGLGASQTGSLGGMGNFNTMTGGMDGMSMQGASTQGQYGSPQGNTYNGAMGMSNLGLDQNAINADPQGFAQFQQGAQSQEADHPGSTYLSQGYNGGMQNSGMAMQGMNSGMNMASFGGGNNSMQGQVDNGGNVANALFGGFKGYQAW